MIMELGIGNWELAIGNWQLVGKGLEARGTSSLEKNESGFHDDYSRVPGIIRWNM